MKGLVGKMEQAMREMDEAVVEWLTFSGIDYGAAMLLYRRLVRALRLLPRKCAAR
jgi:hypothetical protein